MKLILAKPKNDVDESFEVTILAENQDLGFLKSEGCKFALENGRGDEAWISGNIIDGRAVDDVKRWHMIFADGSFLIIEKER